MLLTACGSSQSQKEADDAAISWSGKLNGEAETGGKVWDYQLTTKTVEKAHWDSRDHRVVASCTYEVPRMKIVGGLDHADKNEVNPAHAIVKNFNDYFDSWLASRQGNFKEIAAMAQEDYDDQRDSDVWSEKEYAYTDQVTAAFWGNRRLVCITLSTASFTGGVHEITGQESYTFDLRTGKMVSINDMVMDYNGLRDAVTEEILQQAALRQDEEQVNFFSDYEKVIPEWMTRNVFFGPLGLTVAFDVYDIAPYASGEQMFSIPYEMVIPYLNEYGREVLELPLAN